MAGGLSRSVVQRMIVSHHCLKVYISEHLLQPNTVRLHSATSGPATGRLASALQAKFSLLKQKSKPCIFAGCMSTQTCLLLLQTTRVHHVETLSSGQQFSCQKTRPGNADPSKHLDVSGDIFHNVLRMLIRHSSNICNPFSFFQPGIFIFLIYLFASVRTQIKQTERTRSVEKQPSQWGSWLQREQP